MKVEISSRKLVKPSNLTPDHPQIYKLCFFDQFAPPVHIPLLYFYAADAAKPADKIRRLEQSLSDVLTVFYVEAGRYHKADLLVDCNDEGAAFLEATVDVNLSDFLEAGPEIDALKSFVPWEIGPTFASTTPLVAVQVTIFACGGIGLCFHNSHVISDGFSGTGFARAWSMACRIGTESVEKPSYVMPELFPSRDISAVVGLPAPLGPPPKVINRRVTFDAETIGALKARAGGGSGHGRSMTRLVTVLATIWKALIRAQQATHQGQLRRSVMAISINLRGRTALKTPDNLAGNFYTITAAKFPAEEDKTEPNHLANLIKASIKTTLASYAKLSTSDEIVAAAVGDVNEVRRQLHDQEVDVLFVTSMCGFPVYDMDFGWGQPELVSNVPAPVEILALMNKKDGGGIEAWVSLKEALMAEFQNDPDIAPLID